MALGLSPKRSLIAESSSVWRPSLLKQAVAPFVKMTEKRIRKKNLTKKTHKNVLKVLVMVKSMVRKFWT